MSIHPLKIFTPTNQINKSSWTNKVVKIALNLKNLKIKQIEIRTVALVWESKRNLYQDFNFSNR